jgi:SAM-dependent methyltransferase
VHDSSLDRMSRFIDEFLAAHRGRALRVLDVGSFDVNGSYRSLFDDPSWTYIGLDMCAGPGVDLVVQQPFRWGHVPSSSFDLVISGQAFEHIEFPWVTILEVERVLRAGGLCCLVVPSSGPEHRYPRDCWRFYPDGLVALAHWGDLDVVRAETHWNDEGWGEDSDQWHDSVLVARKPMRPGTTLSRAKRAALRRILNLQATRRDSTAD